MAHPVLNYLKSRLNEDQFDELSAYLNLISSELPLEALYYDYSISAQDMDQGNIGELEADQILDKISKMFDTNSDEFLAMVNALRLTEHHREIVKKYLEK